MHDSKKTAGSSQCRRYVCALLQSGVRRHFIEENHKPKEHKDYHYPRHWLSRFESASPRFRAECDRPISFVDQAGSGDETSLNLEKWLW